MRTLKIILMTAMVLALGASTASASSVTVIWQPSGTSVTSVAANTAVTGNIVMSIGAGDSALASFGNGYELSATYGATLSVIGNTNTPPGGAVPLATGPDNGLGLFENIVAAAGFGTTLAAGTSAIIGTITVHSGGAGGTVTVGPFGAFGDDIVLPGAVSILSEFTFTGGTIIVPEPTTASLLGLGLLGLTVAGRQRKR